MLLLERRLCWAVLRDTGIARKCTADGALVPSSESSQAEFYGTRDAISRALSGSAEATGRLTTYPGERLFCNCRLAGLGIFFSVLCFLTQLETDLTE